MRFDTGLVVLLCLSLLPSCTRLPADSEARAADAKRSPSAAMAAAHPLDPLSEGEIRAAVATAKADPRLASALFPSISLQEPPKAAALAWQPGHAIRRQARLQAMSGKRVYDVVVDVSGLRLESVTERTGVEPSLTSSELGASGVVLSNDEFLAGLKKRGITDPEKVFCAPFSAGYFGDPFGEGRRLIKVGCFDTRRTTTNVFGWPIEGLYALVDLRTREVLRVTDGGVVPISDAELNFNEAASGPLRDPRKPVVLAHPSGGNVIIDGHQVAWGQWRFHTRVDPRVGVVISMARWRDGSTLRSVLYQGYLSEMFVPYMDADYGWQSRTYFDTGEYGAGVSASPLEAGVDCPPTASFMPAVLANDKGEPFTIPNALCVFERSAGEPIWRHYEASNQTYEGRASVDLVVRMAAAMGNYDYLFDWVFSDGAEIEARVGATGIDALKGVVTRHVRESTAAPDTRYGALVAPNLVAVNHDHHFNFRLDVDVDGIANTFNLDTYRSVTLPPDSPRRSIYVVERQLADTEAQAQLDTTHASSKIRIVNEGRTNAVGNSVSYEVLTVNHARLLLDPRDWPARRAAFLQHDIWVTPYEPEERFAGGDFMLGSKGTDGLHVWAARNRAIRDRDIVLWVNMGMHHLTRAEDIPVMPTIWHSFKLRPHNFFNKNPSVDLKNQSKNPS